MWQFLKERLPLAEFSAHLRKPLPKHINLLFSLGSLAMFLLLARKPLPVPFWRYTIRLHPNTPITPSPILAKRSLSARLCAACTIGGASAMVIIVFLHLLRVVLYSSYKAPREFTWIFGVLLLLIVLRFRIHRLPAPVGRESILGNSRRCRNRQHCSRIR